jgi:hypothetical protein
MSMAVELAFEDRLPIIVKLLVFLILLLALFTFGLYMFGIYDI